MLLEGDVVTLLGGSFLIGKKRAVSEVEGKKWAGSRGFGYFETSAKDGATSRSKFPGSLHLMRPLAAPEDHPLAPGCPLGPRRARAQEGAWKGLRARSGARPQSPQQVLAL